MKRILCPDGKVFVRVQCECGGFMVPTMTTLHPDGDTEVLFICEHLEECHFNGQVNIRIGSHQAYAVVKGEEVELA